MSKKERVVCAAINFRVESIAYEDEVSYETLLCTDYDDKFADYKRFELCDLGYEIATEETKGFITSTGRFVDPVEGMRIAIMNNQLKILNENGIKSSELIEEGYTEITINSTERIVVKLSGKLKPEDLY